MKVSNRSHIQPFHAMEVLREANNLELKGKNIWHLETGEPVTGAPEKVRVAAQKYLDSGRIGYTDALGIPDLRKRISLHYLEYYDLNIPEDRIIVTTGSSGGLLLSLLSAFDVGDKVVVTEPGYPAYSNMLKALGLLPIYCSTEADSRYQPTVEQLESLNAKPDGMIIASPANPTGSILKDKEIKTLVDWCNINKVRIIADEVYHRVTYGCRAETILKSTEEAIIINGFSKYYAMTGWRLGWIVIPEKFLKPIERLAQNLFISAPALSQASAIYAFDSSQELDENLKRYERNKDILQASLKRSGFGNSNTAQGAFYLYVDVSPFTHSSQDFCKRMLHEAGVAATPGIDFDRVRGQNYVRFSYAGHTNDIECAAESIEKWIKVRFK